MSLIRAHRERWGVEPICTVLRFAPSTYYAMVSHQPSARQRGDAELKVEIARVHRDNFGVYGIESSGVSSSVKTFPLDVTGCTD